jgi:hypothetical protein
VVGDDVTAAVDALDAVRAVVAGVPVACVTVVGDAVLAVEDVDTSAAGGADSRVAETLGSVAAPSSPPQALSVANATTPTPTIHRAGLVPLRIVRP